MCRLATDRAWRRTLYTPGKTRSSQEVLEICSPCAFATDVKRPFRKKKSELQAAQIHRSGLDPSAVCGCPTPHELRCAGSRKLRCAGTRSDSRMASWGRAKSSNSISRAVKELHFCVDGEVLNCFVCVCVLLLRGILSMFQMLLDFVPFFVVVFLCFGAGGKCRISRQSLRWETSVVAMRREESRTVESKPWARLSVG